MQTDTGIVPSTLLLGILFHFVNSLDHFLSLIDAWPPLHPSQSKVYPSILLFPHIRLNPELLSCVFENLIAANRNAQGSWADYRQILN
jgi:hypothetical protein